VTPYLDTSVLLSAASASPAAGCQTLVQALGNGVFSATISAEVLQELLHAASWRQARAQGLLLVDLTATLFAHPLPITGTTVVKAAALMRTTPRLGTRVAIHAAAMAEARISDVIALDPEFGLISGVRRLSPEDAVNHYRLA
jgi:predicted nucleic acid-binding protein